MMPKRRYGLVLAALLAACGGEPKVGAAPNAPVQGAALPALHARTGAAPGIFDDQGRQVLLRSVNYSALGDYYQDHPDHPSVVRPRSGDLAQMAELGLLGVRLLMNWSQLEPQPGVYNQGYLDEIEAVVVNAAQQGLYVILDMHQDAWGKHLATREAAENCLPPFAPAIGWDGAPLWATRRDGFSTCQINSRELSPAVAQAFTNFFLNTAGIQDHFIGAWQAVVARLAAHSNVAGYDLFNEPHPGYLAATNGMTLLAQFYSRLIEAIRSSEIDAGGFAHIVFFEPSIEWSLTGLTPVPLPSFTSDDNIVFSPHNYCGSISPLPMRTCFQNSANAASLYEATFWAGEWGFFGDPSSFAESVASFAALEDEFLVSGALWQWAQACGDPHTIGTPGNTPPEQTLHLRAIGCPGDVDLGYVEANARVMRRPYPRRTPGRLLRVESDINQNSLLVGGASDNIGAIEIWVPGEAQPGLTADFSTSAQINRVPGGHLVTILTPVGQYAIGVNRPDLDPEVFRPL